MDESLPPKMAILLEGESGAAKIVCLLPSKSQVDTLTKVSIFVFKLTRFYLKTNGLVTQTESSRLGFWGFGVLGAGAA